MEVRVLGPLEVREDDKPIALGGAKQRALLAILALHANEVVSSDRLIDELWGAEVPQTAAKSLQVHVSQLRKVLEPRRKSGQARQLLLTRAPGYLLHLDPDQLDVERFKRLYEEGRETLAAGDPEAAAAKLNEALSLWRGDPLADLTYASFAQSEISRLEEMRLAALEDRVEADIERGRHAAVIGDLERLISSEPLRERPRAQLMLALYRSGRQAEALEAYQDARRTLTEELGIEPGRELKELQKRILDQDPALEAPASIESVPEAPSEGPPATVAAAGAQRVQEEFVGREAEIRDLEVALEGALLGRGALVLVGGEPGIGKSRLVDELGVRARNLNAEVLWGRCWEAGGAPAYWPWVQALRTHLMGVDPDKLNQQLGNRGGEVAHLLPELREVLPELPELELPESEGARFRLFDATGSFLKRAAAERPLVVVLEDLHAADVPSLLFLQFMAREIGDAPLLLVGTYRDIELGPSHPLTSALVELGRQPATRTLLLQGFPERDSSRLITTIAGGPPSRQVVAAIHTGTGGNPLFVGELVRLLASEERLDDRIDEAGVRLAIPRGIRDVIEKRLKRVPDSSREVLCTASALGREFAIDTLAHVTEDPAEAILEQLDEPLREGVVTAGPGAGLRMRFSHVLLRDALYDELGARRRVQLHRTIGDALERLYADDPEPHLAELAHHYCQAGPSGDPQKAHDYARGAGNRAARLFAYEEAARLYQMALRMLGSGADADAKRCTTLLALGGAQLRGGDEETAKETFLAAAELARKTGDAESLARAALGYGSQYWSAARGDRRLIPLLQEALTSLPEGDSALRARVLARLSCAVRDQPTRDRRLALSEEAVDMARRIGDPATQAYAVAARCLAFVGPDNLDAFAATANEAVRLGEGATESEAELTGHWWRHYFEVATGNIQGARRELATAIRLAEELREPRLSWYPAGLDAALALFEGRFEEAGELIAKAHEFGKDALTFNAVASYRLQMFLLNRECGAPPYPEEALTTLIAQSQSYVILRCALASLLTDRGREAEARAIFDELAEDDFGSLYLDEEWLAAMTLLTDVCQSIGDVERARFLYRELLPYRALNAWGFPEIVLGSVERPLGVLATMTGRWEDAVDHFESALEMNQRMGARPWVAHTRHDFARMLLARGEPQDRAQAEELLRSALDTYRELGMQPWEARTTAELAGTA